MPSHSIAKYESISMIIFIDHSLDEVLIFMAGPFFAECTECNLHIRFPYFGHQWHVFPASCHYRGGGAAISFPEFKKLFKYYMIVLENSGKSLDY